MKKEKGKELIPDLFRTEYAKMVSVLCRTFGLSNIELAQDIVSDTFLKAAETWGLKEIPENPSAWLYTVAKNKAKDHFKREDILNKKITPYLVYDYSVAEELDHSFSNDNLNDSLLLMMFTVCNPILNIESQLCLGLRVLCGFSIEEIANALLTSKSVINKRLVRAKEKFRAHNIKIEFPTQKAIEVRLQSVLHMLYLLFNEGYYATSVSEKIREDLCYDAMRLANLLTKDKRTNTSTVNALLALFCFHSSRFEARLDLQGNQILYQDQNSNQWDFELIQQGEYFLAISGKEDIFSRYHLEALIAYWHTRTTVKEELRWQHILSLYDGLLKIENSPIIQLNRSFALSKVKGKQIALTEALNIDLKGNSLYHSLLADLYSESDKNLQVVELQKAISYAKNISDKAHLQKKLDELF